MLIPGKHPRVRHGLYEGTTETKKIESWWQHWPQANIGIATGPDSGLVVIDIDLPKAEPSLQRLEQLGRKLAETLTARTGGGGLHLYFVHPQRALPNTTGRLPGLAETLEGSSNLLGSAPRGTFRATKRFRARCKK